MRLTKRGEYALRSLIRLGLAHATGREWVPGSELADGERLPLKFLEQVLFQLRRQGHVVARRGKLGGYALADGATGTRIGAIVRQIDGKLAPIGCASETAYEPCSCPDEVHCGLRMLMIDVRNAIARILDRYTLGDLITVTLRKYERDGVVPACGALPEEGSGEPRPDDGAILPPGMRCLDEDGFLAMLRDPELGARGAGEPEGRKR